MPLFRWRPRGPKKPGPANAGKEVKKPVPPATHFTVPDRVRARELERETKQRADAEKAAQQRIAEAREKEQKRLAGLAEKGSAVPEFVSACQRKGMNPKTTFEQLFRELHAVKVWGAWAADLQVEANLGGIVFDEAKFWAERFASYLETGKIMAPKRYIK